MEEENKYVILYISFYSHVFLICYSFFIYECNMSALFTRNIVKGGLLLISISSVSHQNSLTNTYLLFG